MCPDSDLTHLSWTDEDDFNGRCEQDVLDRTTHCCAFLELLPIGCDFLGCVEGIEVVEVGRDQVFNTGCHVERFSTKMMSRCGTDL